MSLRTLGKTAASAKLGNKDVLAMYRNGVKVFEKQSSYTGPTPDSLPAGVRGLWLVTDGNTYTDPWGKTTSITPRAGRPANSVASDIVLAASAAGRPFSIHFRYDRTTVAEQEVLMQANAGALLVRTGTQTGLVMFSGFTRTFPSALPAAGPAQHVISMTATSSATTAKVDGVALTNQASASTGTFGTTITVGMRQDGTLPVLGKVYEMVILFGATAAQDLEVHNYLMAGAATPAEPPAPPAPIYQSYYDNDIITQNFQTQVQNVDQPYCIQVATNRTSLTRFEVRSGDLWHGLSTERAELSGISLAYDEDVWISMALEIEPGGAYSTWNVLSQIHGTAGTSPILVTELEGSTFMVKTRHDRSGYVTTTRYSMPFVRGQRYNIVHRIRMSRTGNGLLQTWIDGVKVVDVVAPIGYNLPGSPYWKHGIYRSQSAQTIVGIYGNVEVQRGVSLAHRITNPLPDPAP